MEHIFEQQVFYSDTDAYGVVWHGSYLRWLEMGRVYLCEKAGLFLKELENVVRKSIISKLGNHLNYSEIKSEIINNLSNYIDIKTGRRPIILPVIMDVKKDVKEFN